MNELKTEMQARWNTHADSYDTAHAHGIANAEEQARWINLFQGKEFAKLLDVGCGTGFVALLAARAGLDVTGVDWSEGMMGQAVQKAKDEHLNLQFVLGATEDLPFPDGSFRYLTARHVMWTLTEPQAAFQEWFRVLEPGGCVFADYSPKQEPVSEQHYRLEVEKQLPLNRNVSSDAIADLFRRAGFSDISVQERRYSHPSHDSGETVHGINYLFTCTK